MSARVFVGLSGGVDSSLACALLMEQGYDVTAIYMRNWSRDLPGFRCPWANDLADAERVAVTVGCDLLVWDFEKEYKKAVEAGVNEKLKGKAPQAGGSTLGGKDGTGVKNGFFDAIYKNQAKR